MMMISQVKHHSGVKPGLQSKKPATTNTQTNKPTTASTSKGDTVQLGTANKKLFVGGTPAGVNAQMGNVYKHAIAEKDKNKEIIFSNPVDENTLDVTGNGVAATVVVGAIATAAPKGTHTSSTVKINGDDFVSFQKLSADAQTSVSEITGTGEQASITLTLSSKNDKTNTVKLVGSKADLEKAIANLTSGKTEPATTGRTGKKPTPGNGKTETTSTPTKTTSLSDLSPSSKAYQAKAKEAFLNSLAKNAPQLLAKSVAEVEKEFTVVKKEDGTFTVMPKETNESKKPTNTTTDKNSVSPFVEDNSNLA